MRKLAKTAKSKSTKSRTGITPKVVTVRSRKVLKLVPLRGTKKVAVRKQRSTVIRKKAA